MFNDRSKRHSQNQSKAQRGDDEPMSQEELDEFIVFLKNYRNEEDNDEHETQEYHYDDDWDDEYEMQEYQYDDDWNTEEPDLDRSNYELMKQERNSAILNTCAKAGIFSLMFVGAVVVGVWKATTRQRF